MEAMGMESHVPSNPKGESWTEEKHVHFLNSMEAWFVRTMLENNDRYTLRLDRHLPDTCESTLDSKHNVHKRNNYATSVDFIGPKRSKLKGRPDKRSRRPSQSYHSFQDQVVPQLQNRRQDKDEKHPPNFPPPSMP
ncbi:hypothetical protein E1A91_D09G049000v1 [Gossypium mustelinum]|uniref:Uncharacterized protein n=1 Tax=Gossypium mustelinum TaxID=34275 RepID=A0A5D2TFM4_GOSMU|nr:hypothetical protein E1A91_D09G049000v1 [Gossypium mustelinum]